MYRGIIIFLSYDMAKIVLKSCETCNASTLLHTPAGDVWPVLYRHEIMTLKITLKIFFFFFFFQCDFGVLEQQRKIFQWNYPGLSLVSFVNIFQRDFRGFSVSQKFSVWFSVMMFIVYRRQETTPSPKHTYGS